MFFVILLCAVSGRPETDGSAAGPLPAAPTKTDFGERHTLDVTGVGRLQNTPVASYRYSCLVRGDGRAVCLRSANVHLTPQGRDAASEVALLVEGEPSGWEAVRLPGWDARDLPGRLLLTLTSSDEVIVSWQADEGFGGHSRSRILAKRRGPGSSWSDAIALNDPGSIDVTSFALLTSPGPEMTVLWTDSREEHLDSWFPPWIESYPKVFAREWRRDRMGEPVRVTWKKGKYSAGGVRGCADRQGTLYATWNQIDKDDSSQIQLSRGRGGQWSRPIPISEETSAASGHGSDFDIVPGRNDQVMILWTRGAPRFDIGYRLVTGGVPGEIGGVAGGRCCFATAAGPGGRVDLAYQDSDEASTVDPYKRPQPFHNRHVYYRAWDGARWTPELEVTSDVFMDSTAIGMDAAGRPHLFWLQYAGEQARLIHAVGRATP